MIRFLALLGLLLFTTNISYAQKKTYSGDLNSWFLWLNEAKINKDWSVTSELHLRHASILNDKATFIFRPSVDYKLGSSVLASVGYSFIQNWPHQPIKAIGPFKENNIWFQGILTTSLGEFRFLHRFRQEIRFIENVILNENQEISYDGINNTNRFRYRFQVSADLVPIKNHNLEVIFFSELWLDQIDGLRPTGFARNWFYFGFQYPISPVAKLNIGFMDQFDPISNNQFVHQPALQLSLSTKLIDLKANKDIIFE